MKVTFQASVVYLDIGNQVTTISPERFASPKTLPFCPQFIDTTPKNYCIHFCPRKDCESRAEKGAKKVMGWVIKGGAAFFGRPEGNRDFRFSAQ